MSSRKWYKLPALTLLTILVSLLFVACGNDAPATSISGTTAAATTSAAQAGATTQAVPVATATSTAEPNNTPVGLTSPAPATSPTAVAVQNSSLKGQLTIWSALPERMESFVREQGTGFGKAFPGVKVNIVNIDPAEINFVVQDAVKSKTLPDLILASSDYTLDFTKAKVIQPADKVVDKTFLDKFAPNSLAGSNLNGTQYGIAYTYSGAPVMLYNKKLVPNAPATWDELAKTVTPLYDGKLRQVGLALDPNEPYFLSSLVGGYGGNLLNAQGKPNLDSPEMVSALQFLLQLERDRVVRNESKARDNQLEYAFRDGRLGVFITGDTEIAKYAGAVPYQSANGNKTTPDEKLELAAATLPKLDKTGKSPVPYSNSRAFFVGADVSGNQAKVVAAYLDWVAQTEQQAAIVTKLNLLPATKAYLASDAVAKNDFWNGVLSAMDAAKPLPPTPEMRGVMSSLRQPLQGVIAGAVRPVDAAKQMQEKALQTIGKLTAS
jgi:arabinogalactan oligomer / maltooligosaccharide transport system permease protein